VSWGDDDDSDWCRRCGHPYTENLPEPCYAAGDGQSHEKASDAEAAAIRAARRARRQPRDMAAEAAGRVADERRCARCWTRYRERENEAGACRYHPGRLMDYDRHAQAGDGFAGDFRDCCSYTLAAEGDMSHGCAAGWHVKLETFELGPIARRYEAQRGNQAACIAAYEKKAGAGAAERVMQTRRKVEEFLAGLRPSGLQELDERAAEVLEGPLLSWLIARVRDRQYPSDPREAVIFVLKDPDIKADLRALIGPIWG
jgi:hypothetical protein